MREKVRLVNSDSGENIIKLLLAEKYVKEDPVAGFKFLRSRADCEALLEQEGFWGYDDVLNVLEKGAIPYFDLYDLFGMRVAVDSGLAELEKVYEQYVKGSIMLGRYQDDNHERSKKLLRDTENKKQVLVRITDFFNDQERGKLPRWYKGVHFVFMAT